MLYYLVFVLEFTEIMETGEQDKTLGYTFPKLQS